MINYTPFFSPQEKSKWFMDKKSNEEKEARFSEIMTQPPYPVDEVLGLIAEAAGAKKDEWILAALKAFADEEDFDAAFRVVRDFESDLGAKSRGETVRELLKKSSKDRLVTSFIESVGFGVRPFKDSVARLARLLSFQPGVFVLNSAWGLGEIKRLDAFYRRITVDFRTRRGHQLTFDAACETLVLAPEGHILVTAKGDPDRVQKMLKDEPGEFVKAMLGSFGNMPVTRLEELSAQHGFVKSANWKSFWERARADLRRDKLVEIPTRRAEPLVLKAAAESYGDGWFTAFEQMTDPKSILTAVREFVGAGKFKGLDEAGRKKIADRLAFALKGARKVDDALYARLAACLAELKLDDAVASKARAYLWGESRYLAAARDLPASEVARFVAFLVAENEEEAKRNLFAEMPQMCFPLLAATLEHYRTDEACETAVADLLKNPHAPATLVVLVLGRYHEVKKAKPRQGEGALPTGAQPGEKVEVETETGFKNWSKLPPLVVILTHAIAIGEGRQSGETLKMQNTVRRLFADQKWLGDIFSLLEPADKVLFFERFQASTTWDPSTHHTIVVRMTHIEPTLAMRQVKAAAPEAVERITSLRSYAERKAAYQKLINVEMPENTRRIEFARSYGDLSENAEYQYAKDEQRALMQKQTLMQEEIEAVKPTDFADVAADLVRPGTTVTITAADGAERTYTVLGEWDNDLERGIIANKTRLAQNMLGKKPGDTFDLPDAEGNVSVATIKSIAPLSDEMRAWVQVPPGLSI